MKYIQKLKSCYRILKNDIYKKLYIVQRVNFIKNLKMDWIFLEYIIHMTNIIKSIIIWNAENIWTEVYYWKYCNFLNNAFIFQMILLSLIYYQENYKW